MHASNVQHNSVLVRGPPSSPKLSAVQRDGSRSRPNQFAPRRPLLASLYPRLRRQILLLARERHADLCLDLSMGWHRRAYPLALGRVEQVVWRSPGVDGGVADFAAVTVALPSWRCDGHLAVESQ